MRASLRISLRHVGLFLIGLALALLASPRVPAVAQEPPMRWDGLFELISGRYDYPPPWPGPFQVADAESGVSRHAISGDGRYVVFHSYATNLGSPTPAIYLRDRRTGQTELLTGNTAPYVAISTDGSHLAYELCDPWMRPDQASICDVWAMDLRTWTWTPVSTTVDGTFGTAASREPVLSANGRFVVFSTTAPNLSGVPGGAWQIVLRDRDADGNGIFDEPGTALLETITPGGNESSDTAEVSDDGRFVAFRSLASNLVPDDTNGAWDVFLRDRQTGETRRLNVGPEGQQSTHSIDQVHLSMSADGRYVAFGSTDGLLAPSSIDDTNGVSDVFVYDAQSQGLTRIDIGWGPPIAGGYVPGNGPTGWPTLSADGRYVSVQSSATNVEIPPVAGTTQVYVIDRLEQRATRISIRADRQDPDYDSLRPAMSADGSVVLFSSRATNLVEGITTTVEQLFSAVHLEITPANVLVPGGAGGVGTFTVTTQQHTLWWAEWDWTQYWFQTTATAPQGVGNGEMSFQAWEANPDPAQRSMAIRVGQSTVTFTQDVGLSITSLSPTSGPMSGGTTVTVRGTGFAPGMEVYLGQTVPAEYVDATTLTFVTPPSTQRGWTMIAVETSDWRNAWLDNAFFYLDSTPPEVWGWTEGTQGQNGWYTGDVTVHWWSWDPESVVTSTTCTDILVTTDTIGTTYSCSATSEGGTGSGAITVRRDTTPPAIAVTTPSPQQLLELNSTVASAFTCTDATSGVADCPAGWPIYTSTPGWNTFTAGALDVAGNGGMSGVVEYAVSTGVCSPPADGLQTWMRFDGDLTDVMSTSATLNNGMPPDTYVEGEAGQAYKFVGRGSGSLEYWHNGSQRFTSAMSVAMWIKPGTNTNGTLVKQDQYRVERSSTGAINWTLSHPDPQPPSFGLSNAKAPMNAWSHVVFTYNAGEVKVYVNGRLDRTWTVAGTTLRPSTFNSLRIGGPDGWGGWPYVGAFDELQFFNRAIDPAEVESIFLAGASGMCVLVDTALEVSSPITATYAGGTYLAVATLRDVNGTPLAGKTVRLEQRTSDLAGEVLPTITQVTDANGQVRWDAPFDVVAGTYPSGFAAYFAGDLQHAHSGWATATVIVGKATPQITWATPAAITHGTALSYASQLNASANVPGSFSYSPGSGSVPGAGTRTLSVTFYPTSYQNYENASATVDIEVARALPTMSVTGGTFTYDRQPHPATATATDYRGLALVPVTLTYNGSPDAPVDAGVYTAVATYAGDANHLPHSASTTVTINKATPSVLFSAPLTFTYDAQPHGLVASVYGVGSVPLGPVPVTYDGAADAPVNAGTYAASATFEGNTNYVARTSTTTLRINPATPAVTVSGGPFTFDGQPHEATAAVTGVGGELPAGAVAVTYNGGAELPVNAGTYAVHASVAASGNYTAASGSGTLTISKATPVVTVTDSTFTYGGGPFMAPAAVTGVGGEALAPAAVQYDGTSSLPFNAGVYSVVATYAGSANYTSASGSGTLTVLKATPTFIVAGGTPTYDGQPHPAGVILAGQYGDVMGPYTVTYNGSPDPPVNAGAYDVVAVYDGAANYDAATATGTVTIAKAAITLSVTGGTFTYDGQPHPASAVATGVGGEPLGPVAFTYNGSAAPPVDGGTYAVEATFAGSANYAATTSTAEVRVLPAWPTVSVTGGTFTYDGQPHPATATATGVVSETLSPVSVTYWRDGFGWFEVPIGTGTYEVAATFAGSANYYPKTERTTLVIGKRTPVLSWSAPAGLTYGTPLGATQLNATTNVPGTFTYLPAAGSVLAAGAGQPLSATFTPSDTANYSGGTVATVITVTPAPLTVRANDAVKRFGAPVPPFTATFVGLVNADSPASLGGVLAFSTTATEASPVGTYPIVPGGVGSPNYAVTFVSGSLGVVKGAVSVAVAASPEPSGYQMPMTFTATVAAAAPAAGSPAGTIRFFDGATLIGMAAVSGGVATLTTAGLNPGAHSIEARYDGDGSFETGIASASHVVDPSTSTPALSISSSRNPSSTGQNVTLTANLTMSSGSVNGTVAFYDGATLIGSSTIAAGRATLSTTSLAAGSHAITARFLGSSGAPPSFSPVFVQAVGASGWRNRTTTTTVVSSASPSLLGETVTFTATVSGSSGSPAGRVLFMIDGEVAGDPAGVLLTPLSGGKAQASMPVTALAHGSHKVTATYLGNSTYKGSTGNLTQSVN